MKIAVDTSSYDDAKYLHYNPAFPSKTIAISFFHYLICLCFCLKIRRPVIAKIDSHDLLILNTEENKLSK